jgi:type I restriction-modification system DNA methylase subunit
VAAAVSVMAAAGVEARGAIFTRREVVEFILDLTGYTDDQPLHHRRLLEPSMGHGDFLTPVIDRLLIAYERETAGRSNVVRDLASCLCAVELHRSSYDATRNLVSAALRAKGLTKREANALCDHWLVQDDFLLTPLEGTFTHVIGNPPYVRQEMIPDALMAEQKRGKGTCLPATQPLPP